MVEITTTGWYVLSSNEDKTWTDFKNYHGLNDKTVGKYIYELKPVEHDKVLTTEDWNQINTNPNPTLEHKKGYWVRVIDMTANQDSLPGESVPLIGRKLGNNIPINSTGNYAMAISNNGQSLTVATVGHNSGAIAINGYYPLYTSENEANAASTEAGGDGSSHTHEINDGTYYMPDGLQSEDQYHGTYTGSNSSFGVTVDSFGASLSGGGHWDLMEDEHRYLDFALLAGQELDAMSIGMSNNGNNIATVDRNGQVTVFSNNNDSANSTDSWTMNVSESVDSENRDFKAITISNDGSTIATMSDGNGNDTMSMQLSTYTVSGGTGSDNWFTQTGTTNVDYDTTASTIAMTMNDDALEITVAVSDSDSNSNNSTIINFSSSQDETLEEISRVNIYHQVADIAAVTFNGDSLIMAGSQNPVYHQGLIQRTIAIQEYDSYDPTAGHGDGDTTPVSPEDPGTTPVSPEDPGTTPVSDQEAHDQRIADAAAISISITDEYLRDLYGYDESEFQALSSEVQTTIMTNLKAAYNGFIINQDIRDQYEYNGSEERVSMPAEPKWLDANESEPNPYYGKNSATEWVKISFSDGDRVRLAKTNDTGKILHVMNMTYDSISELLSAEVVSKNSEAGLQIAADAAAAAA